MLIDSRTGLSDIGGVCSVQLPTVLVLVFSANDQSFEGGVRFVRAVQRERRNFGRDRGQLSVIPLLSRWCGTEETKLSEIWMENFDAVLPEFLGSWLPKEFSPKDFIEAVRVPHVAAFTFGEPLPVLSHSLTDPAFPGLAFDRLARLLTSDLADAGKIIDPFYEPKISIDLVPREGDRDDLVSLQGGRVYISSVASEFAGVREALVPTIAGT